MGLELPQGWILLEGVYKLRWEDKVGRWSRKCQRFADFTNVNQGYLGGQEWTKFDQRCLWKSPYLESNYDSGSELYLALKQPIFRIPNILFVYFFIDFLWNTFVLRHV